jgi:hypothetical protein
MIQIRRNVFETNSSSTHSLTICTNDEYCKWERGELYFKAYDEEFITREEVIKLIREDKWINKDNEEDIAAMSDTELLAEYALEVECYSFDVYWDNDYLESYCENYTSPSGDKIVIFGHYGYDG